MALLIPFPQLDSTISAIAKPFQHEVWIGIGLSFLVAAVVLCVISRIQRRQSFHEKTRWFPHFWFLFRAVINPNGVIHFTLATRLVIASWCLMGIVFVNSYTSSLLSYLLAPTFLPVISTVQDLADSHIVQITSLKHTSVDSALFAATSGSFAKLGASLRAHPENLLETLDNIEDIVFNQRKAFPYVTGRSFFTFFVFFIASVYIRVVVTNHSLHLCAQQETSLKQRIYDDFKATRQCRLSIAKEPLFPDQIAFALPKSSSLTTDYNYELIWLRQLGLLNHWANSFLPRPYRCSAPLASLRPTSNERLTLNYLSSAFLLYGVGVGISLLAFVLEVISTWWNATTQVKSRHSIINA